MDKCLFTTRSADPVDVKQWERQGDLVRRLVPTAPLLSRDALLRCFARVGHAQEMAIFEHASTRTSTDVYPRRSRVAAFVDIVFSIMDCPWKMCDVHSIRCGSRTYLDYWKFLVCNPVWRVRACNILFLWERGALSAFAEMIYFMQNSVAAKHEQREALAERGTLWCSWLHRFPILGTFEDLRGVPCFKWLQDNFGDGKKIKRLQESLARSLEANLALGPSDEISPRQLEKECRRGRLMRLLHTVLDVDPASFEHFWAVLVRRVVLMQRWKAKGACPCYFHGLPVLAEGVEVGTWKCTLADGTPTASTTQCKSPADYFAEHYDADENLCPDAFPLSPASTRIVEAFASAAMNEPPSLPMRIYHPTGTAGRSVLDVITCNTDWQMAVKSGVRRTADGEQVESVLTLGSDDCLHVNLPLVSALRASCVGYKFPSLLRKIVWHKDAMRRLFEANIPAQFALQADFGLFWETYVCDWSPTNVDRALGRYKDLGQWERLLRTKHETKRTAALLIGNLGDPAAPQYAVKKHWRTFMEQYLLMGNVRGLYHDWKALKAAWTLCMLELHCDSFPLHTYAEREAQRARYLRFTRAEFFHKRVDGACHGHGLFSCWDFGWSCPGGIAEKMRTYGATEREVSTVHVWWESLAEGRGGEDPRGGPFGGEGGGGGT